MRPGVGVIASRWPQISIYGACGSRYRWDIDGSFSISPSPFSRFLFSGIIYTFSIIRCFHSPEGGRRRNGRKETRTISVLLHPEEFSTEIHRFPFRFRYKGKLSCWETKVEERERERNSNIKQIFLQILFLQIRRGKREKSFSSLFLSLSKFAFFSNFSSKSLSLYIIQARSRSLPKKGKSWPIRRHPLATQRVSYRFPKRNKAVSRGFQVALRKEFTFSKTFYNSSSFQHRLSLSANYFSPLSKNFILQLCSFLPSLSLAPFSGYCREKILLSLSLSWTATGAVTDRSSAHPSSSFRFPR